MVCVPGLSEQLTHALGKMPNSWLVGLALRRVVVAGDVARRATDVRQAQPTSPRGTCRRLDSSGGQRQPGHGLRRDSAGCGSDRPGTRAEAAVDAGRNDHHISSGCENMTLPIIVRNVRNVAPTRTLRQCLAGVSASSSPIRSPSHQSARRILHDRTGQAAARLSRSGPACRGGPAGGGSRPTGDGWPPGGVAADLIDGGRRCDR